MYPHSPMAHTPYPLSSINNFCYAQLPEMVSCIGSVAARVIHEAVSLPHSKPVKLDQISHIYPFDHAQILISDQAHTPYLYRVGWHIYGGASSPLCSCVDQSWYKDTYLVLAGPIILTCRFNEVRIVTVSLKYVSDVLL
jgi:hypothetical protein